MSAIKPVYLNEILSHHPIIEAINDEAFGPGRFVRAAERVREQGPHDAAFPSSRQWMTKSSVPCA